MLRTQTRHMFGVHLHLISSKLARRSLHCRWRKSPFRYLIAISPGSKLTSNPAIEKKTSVTLVGDFEIDGNAGVEGRRKGEARSIEQRHKESRVPNRNRFFTISSIEDCWFHIHDVIKVAWSVRRGDGRRGKGGEGECCQNNRLGRSKGERMTDGRGAPSAAARKTDIHHHHRRRRRRR